MALAGAFWAGRATMTSAPETSAKTAPQTAEVQTATVGKQITLSVTVVQEFAPVGSASMTGVVTSVIDSGRVAEGGLLYSVNAVPVRAVVGKMPFYRPLAVGAVGEDVQQLEAALVRMGYLDKADLRFDTKTEAALKAWRSKVGDPPAAGVPLGTLVAFDSLPATVMVDPKLVRVGKMVQGSEEFLTTPVGKPTFELLVSDQQATLLSQGTRVDFKADGHSYQAAVADRVNDETGQVRLHLQGVGGQSVCGSVCEPFRQRPTSSYLGSASLVPPVTGPAVPVAAITTDANGQAWVDVVTSTGIVHTAVTVKGSENGVAVVSGVTAGAKVRLPDGDRPR